MQRLKLARYDPVIYCYELQLHPSVHRKGLGKRLMQMLELVVSRPYCVIYSSNPAALGHLDDCRVCARPDTKARLIMCVHG